MEHVWGMDYSEQGVVSRNNLYVVNDGGSVKASPDAPNLAVCIPTRGTVPIELFMALKRMATPINMRSMYIYSRDEMGSSGRDKMTRIALDKGADFICYIDDDVLVPPDMIYKMMVHMQKDPSIGLVTGVYTTKSVPPHPHIYKENGGAHYWGFSMSPYDPPEDIWGCGAGCLLVRADALRKLPAPYWAERVVKTATNDMQILGHDLRFCELIRSVGYRVVVDGSIQCDHFDQDKGVFYRIPRNSPPVKKFKSDPRNDEYWMRWWGVHPSGNGAQYEQLLDRLETVIEPDKWTLVVGGGAGVVAQVCNNLGRGRVRTLAAQPDLREFCEAVRLPWTACVDRVFNTLIVCEPRVHNMSDDDIVTLIEETNCNTVVIFSHEPTNVPGVGPSRVEGDWHVAIKSDLAISGVESNGIDSGS